MEQIVIQALGGIALIFWALSIQNKSKKKILRLQNIANAFYGIEYVFLGAYSAVGMSIVSVIRGIIFYSNEKNKKENSKILVIVISIVIIILGILTYNQWYSVIPIIITLIYTISTYQKNTRMIRIGYLIAAIGWIFYNYIVGAYVPMVGNIIEIISASIAIVKFDIKKFEEK